MRKIVKEQWLTALRSGKYMQTTGQLKSAATERFCCLGVLCDLYLLENRLKWDVDENTGRASIDHHRGNLPPNVHEWAELSPDPYIKGYGYLTELNDNANMDFKQIADLIEQHL